MQSYFALPLLLALGLFSSTSFAQIMDFETFPDSAQCPDGGTGVIENGLSLIDDTPIPPFSDEDSCVFGANNTFPLVGATNGTSVFGWCGVDCPNPQVITLTLTRQDGAPFDLQSIDFSRTASSTENGAVNITGYPAGGGAPVTIQHMITSDAWVTVNFDSRFSNLDRVEIVNEAFPATNRLLDNIVTSQAGASDNATPVPVMGLFGLLLLAAGLLLTAGGALRRR
ncbi:MAG: hypothetical protein U5K56_03420 [Halioglobus sp.]|nr:hypothetical protein [Halioglobus sp.]